MYESKVHYGYSVSDSETSDDTDNDSDTDDIGSTYITVAGGNTTRVTAKNVVNLPCMRNLRIGDGTVVVVGHRHHRPHNTHHKHQHSESHSRSSHRETESHSQKLTDSKSAPSRRDMNHVCKNIGKEWKTLGRSLGLSRGQLESIEVDYHVEGHFEMAYQTLLKWQRQNGGRATLQDLAKALDSIGMSELAAEIPVE